MALQKLRNFLLTLSLILPLTHSQAESDIPCNLTTWPDVCSQEIQPVCIPSPKMCFTTPCFQTQDVQNPCLACKDTGVETYSLGRCQYTCESNNLPPEFLDTIDNPVCANYVEDCNHFSCRETFRRSTLACQNADVLYFTLGICPDQGWDPKAVLAEQAGFPDAEEQAGFPNVEQQAGFPDAEEQAGFPDAEEQAGYPNQEEQAGFPNVEQQAGFPDAEEQAGFPDAEEQAGYPNIEQQAGFPEEQAGYPNAEEQAGYPNAEEQAGYPNTEEQAGYPNGEEIVIVEEEEEEEPLEDAPAPEITLFCGAERLEECPDTNNPVCVTGCVREEECRRTEQNACSACSDHNVLSYTPGACEAERVTCLPSEVSPINVVCVDPLDQVCGYSLECMEEPCGTTAGNVCEACNLLRSDYYIRGACPV